jgi:hypothetical protein
MRDRTKLWHCSTGVHHAHAPIQTLLLESPGRDNMPFASITARVLSSSP